MRIKKIIIDGIQCFKHIELVLSNDNKKNDWVVLLGNNGTGKTTLIRCIALGMCEESGAAGLLDELATDWIRKEGKNTHAKIRIEFENIDQYKKSPFIETTIKYGRFGEVELTQNIYPKKSKIWDNLFICGYGANRRSYGTTSYNQYTVVDAIYSLFNYKTDMQNIELAFRRIQEEIKLDELFPKLEHILMLEKGSIKMKRNGVHITGPWGSYMPIGALGDGYQSTMAWIMDMYSWKLLFEIKLMDPEITGIVFLDEIEQHLHPIWQSEIVNRLSEQFKNIQFITSTHSPLVALNSFSSNHENFNSKLFVLDWYKNQVNISEISEPLHELDYDQLLASEAFGHMYNLNPIVSELLKEMSKLASIDNPDNFQIAKLKKVKQGLKNIIYPTGATLIEREVERDYFQELVKKNKELKALLKTKNDKN